MNRHRTYWSLMGPASESEIMAEENKKDKTGFLTQEEREAIESIVQTGMQSEMYKTDSGVKLRIRALRKCLREDAK